MYINGRTYAMTPPLGGRGCPTIDSKTFFLKYSRKRFRPDKTKKDFKTRRGVIKDKMIK